MSYSEFRSASGPSATSPNFVSPSTQRTSVPPQEPAAGAYVVDDMQLNDLLLAPGREVLPKLSPNGEPNTSWFRRRNRNAICKSILKCFHSLLELPYPTYAHVPSETKRMWFRSFAQDWNWDPIHTSEVRTAFNLQAKTQYKSNMTEWKKNWRLNKNKPAGLNEDVWVGLKAYWQLESTASIAETNSQNRRSSRGGKGASTHNCGAKTREERELEMTAERGGVPPDWLELMRDMHTNKTTGEVQDPVARELLETLTKLKEDKETQLQQSQSTIEGSTSSNVMSREEINNMVLENIPVKKGRRYGVGRVSEGISSTQLNSSSTGLVYEMEQLKTDLIEERAKREALEDQLRVFAEFMARTYPGDFSASQPSQPSEPSQPDE